MTNHTNDLVPDSGYAALPLIVVVAIVAILIFTDAFGLGPAIMIWLLWTPLIAFMAAKITCERKWR